MGGKATGPPTSNTINITVINPRPNLDWWKRDITSSLDGERTAVGTRQPTWQWAARGTNKTNCLRCLFALWHKSDQSHDQHISLRKDILVVLCDCVRKSGEVFVFEQSALLHNFAQLRMTDHKASAKIVV